jgi:hypothetical protein
MNKAIKKRALKYVSTPTLLSGKEGVVFCKFVAVSPINS